MRHRGAPRLAATAALVAVGILVQACGAWSAAVNASAEVCSNADWKVASFAAKPAPDSEVLAGKPDGDKAVSYARTQVQPKLYPQAALLALTLALLLIFLVWRVMRCCCRVCCHCCCMRVARNPRLVLTARGMKVLKAAVILMTLGILAICTFGMSRADPEITDKAFTTLDVIKGFVDGLLNVADDVITAVQNVDSTLDNVTVIMLKDVNASDIQTNIKCLVPWLSGLVNPHTVEQHMRNVDDSIALRLQPTIVTLQANMTLLLGTVLPMLSNASAQIVYTNPFLSSYQTQANDFMASVSAMPSTYPGSGYESDPNFLALKDRTAALAPGDTLNSKAANLTETDAALETFKQAKQNTTLTDVSSGISTMQSVILNMTYTQLPALTSDLRGVSAGYVAVGSCMTGLLSRVTHINDTVIGLPADLQTDISQLKNTKISLDSFVYSSSNSPDKLAADIDSMKSQLALPPATNTTLQTLGNMQSQLNSAPDPTPMQLYILNVRSLTVTANGSMVPFAAALDAFVVSPSSTTWDTLYSARTPASANINNVRTALAALPPTASATFSSAGNVQAQIAALPPQQGQLDSMTSAQSAISGLPARTPYYAQLTPIEAAYDALPANKADLLTSANSSVANLNTQILSAVQDAKKALNDTLGDFPQQLADARRDTVGKIDDKKAEYKPQVDSKKPYLSAGYYLLFGLAILAAICCSVAVLIHCQALATGCTFALLLLTLLYCIVGAVFLLVAVVGNDMCTNTEAKFTGWLTASTDNANTTFKIQTISNYYFYDTGGNLSSVIDTAFGYNIDMIFRDINKTRDDALQQVSGSYVLRPKLQAIMDSVRNDSNVIIARVQRATDMVTYESVHPVYSEAKSFVCCDVVNLLGNLWLAMFIAAFFALALIIAMLFITKRLDNLPPRACCGCGTRSYSEFEKLDGDDPASPRSKFLQGGAKGKGPKDLSDPSLYGNGGGDGVTGGTGGLIKAGGAPGSMEMTGYPQASEASTGLLLRGQGVQHQSYTAQPSSSSTLYARPSGAAYAPTGGYAPGAGASAGASAPLWPEASVHSAESMHSGLSVTAGRAGSSASLVAHSAAERSSGSLLSPGPKKATGAKKKSATKKNHMEHALAMQGLS